MDVNLREPCSTWWAGPLLPPFPLALGVPPFPLLSCRRIPPWMGGGGLRVEAEAGLGPCLPLSHLWASCFEPTPEHYFSKLSFLSYITHFPSISLNPMTDSWFLFHLIHQQHLASRSPHAHHLVPALVTLSSVFLTVSQLGSLSSTTMSIEEIQDSIISLEGSFNLQSSNTIC